MKMKTGDDTTLYEGREFVFANRKDGCDCPCCDRWIDVYKWSMFKTQIITLITLCQLFRKEPRWYHVNEFDHAHGEFAKLRNWGLVEEKVVYTKKGVIKKRSGLWKPKSKAYRFLDNKIRLPKYILLHVREFLGFDGNETVNIHDVWEEKFYLEQHMNLPIGSNI